MMILQATEACGSGSGKKAKARDRRACSLTGWLAAIGNFICPCTLRRHFLQCAPAADADFETRFKHRIFNDNSHYTLHSQKLHSQIRTNASISGTPISGVRDIPRATYRTAQIVPFIS